MAANLFRISEVSLAFAAPSQGELLLVLPGGTFVLPVGLDGNYRTVAAGPSGFTTAMRGRWDGERDFITDMKDVGGSNRFRIGFSFVENGLTVSVDDLTGLMSNQTIAGQARQ
jgi:hypothetical protein